MAADKAHAAETAQICRTFGLRRLWLFGSAARGQDPAAIRDLDFLVEYDDPQPGQYADACFELTERLQEAIGYPVDLVETEAIGNPYFGDAVDKSRIMVFERP